MQSWWVEGEIINNVIIMMLEWAKWSSRGVNWMFEGKSIKIKMMLEWSEWSSWVDWIIIENTTNIQIWSGDEVNGRVESI